MSNDSSIDLTEDKLSQLFSKDPQLSDKSISEISEVIASVEIDLDLLNESQSSNNQDITEVQIQKQLAEGPANDDIRNILLKAKLPQKIKLGLLGNALCRSLLIRDSNKMIQQCVLRNPRIQISEIEEFSKNANLSETVLREIGNNSQWMRSYSVKLGLVFNPKTPQDVSIKWIKFLNSSDLRRLAKSKNVPSVIVVTARKRLAEMDEK